MEKLYTLGVDVGSTASKCVILDNGKEILDKVVIDVGAGTSGPDRAINEILEKTGLKIEDMKYILATGYGRNSLDTAHNQMSELSCHAKGAYFLFPDVKSVIDIGGQDAKVLRVGANGMIENFVMNDKCAAGTGRFLEVMAKVLELEIDDMGRLHFESKERASISSTCTVFAESEVISQLAKKTKKEDIIAGIHYSVGKRVSGLSNRVGLVDRVVMTGGVAKNAGIVDALEEATGHKLHVSPLAQYNGAIGAALFAYEKYMRGK